MDANSPGSTTHQGGRGGSAAASRGHRVVGLVTSLALVFGLTVFMPQQASADPAQPPPATEPAVDPASPSLLSDDTSRPVVRILRLPDSSTVVVLPADEARARIDEALKELEAQVEQARRVEEQRQAQQAQVQQQVQQQVIRQQQVQAQAQAISEAEAAQAEADARLQEALAALAKALSTSQCTTVGGTNGTQASISCPMADGSEATVSGDDNVQVVVPTPSPAPASSPSPTPSSSPSPSPEPGSSEPADDAEGMSASGLPDDPVTDSLSSGDLAAALSQAKSEWESAGADASGVSASVGDLSGTGLGSASGSSITIDGDAAGWGWSRMSLITVVRHEVGHAIGLGHSSALMDDTLEPGEREELAEERRTSLEATDVVLRDNGCAGLAVAGTHRVSVTQATFAGNGECGLCFLGDSDGSVSGSAFDGNKVGVAVADEARPTLLDLTIDGGGVGLQVEGSAAPIVDGATISGSSRAAVIVGGKATGALASVVCKGVDYGIVVTDTAAPTLTSNTCALARGSIGSPSPSPSPGG